ncbi:hypothetical protein EDC01DRAFT_298409 [Geopyxis carbonaria]|nr:hypothetical protein EDC01DRAFT_298409 [Geopyxis carbonaria]
MFSRTTFVTALFLLTATIHAQDGDGTQFITGVCTSDADCASACCGFNSGKCAAPLVAQERDGGCGFNGAAAPVAATASAAPVDASAVGSAVGTQFITGECTSDADCASTCCGFNSGKCAAPLVAQERDGGCGFSGTVVAADVVETPTAEVKTAAAGTQFITGECSGDADCASACCGFNSGKCAAPIVAQERDGGCGFGDAVANDDAVKNLRGRRYVEM